MRAPRRPSWATSRVRVALHERDESGGSEGGVLDGGSLGAEVAEIVAHAAAPLHELNLLLVDAHDAAGGLWVPVESDDEAVAQRHSLHIVADAGHGAALRHDVAEVAEQGEDLVVAHGVGVLGLDAGELGGDAVVHVVGRELVEGAEGVLEGVLAGPDASRELVAVEVFHRGLVGLVVCVGGALSFHMV